MAVTKIPKGIELITQFVRGQFAKRSAKKTGIAGLKKASDAIIQSNVKNIEIILKNMGIDPNYLKSTDDVLKHMNIHKAMMNQHIKKQFGELDLGQGIKSLEKKPTTESLLKGEKYTDERGRTWDFKGEGEKYDDITKKMWKDRPFPGFTPKIVQDKTLLKDSPERIAKMKADNKAAIKRLQEKKEKKTDDC